MSILRKMFIIGLVWPEPNSSAAGVRMVQLIQHFKQYFSIQFLCAASKSEHSFPLDEIGVKTVDVLLNDSSFDVYIESEQPEVILFDRYITEEQFSWRVKKVCPQTLFLLDTEDLHFLREARRLAVKTNSSLEYLNLHNEITFRELASIYRCDLTLIISKYEMDLLQTRFKIDEELLFYLPMISETTLKTKESKSFEEREGFMFIGNFLHEPNWDAVKKLKTTIWPLLSSKCPGSSLHIYGAYPSQKVFDLHSPKDHFLVHGRAENISQTFSQHRVMLAPLQFGAGVKGKLLDAMLHEIPSVTTPIGIESLGTEKNWGGFVAEIGEDFCNKAAQLYLLKDTWLNSIAKGNANYTKICQESNNQWILLNKEIEKRIVARESYRRRNFIGQMFQYHLLKSTTYFSKWIEEKNKK